MRISDWSSDVCSSDLPWRFVEACSDLAEGLRYDAAAVERNKGRPLTEGELGCYSSHFTIWREMAEQGIAQCIVLEDDTIVDWAFMAQLAATDLAARDIPYLRLYAKFPTFSRIVDRKSVVKGKSVSVRVDIGGRRIIKKKKREEK